MRRETQNNVNKTWILLQKTGGKDEENIVFMQKLQRTSRHWTENVKTHKMTTQKLVKIAIDTKRDKSRAIYILDICRM
jgi:hypothetical protein